MGLLSQMLAEKHDTARTRESQQFEAYKSVLSNPNATDEGKEYALGQIMGLAGVDGAGKSGGGSSGSGGGLGGFAGKVGKNAQAILPVFKHLLGIGAGVTPASASPTSPASPQAAPVSGNVQSDDGQSVQSTPTPIGTDPSTPPPSPIGTDPNAPRTTPLQARPRLLMTASERIARDQAAYKAKLETDSGVDIAKHNTEADADQARSLAGVGKLATEKARVYNELIQNGMDKRHAAEILGLKELPPPSVKRVEYDTKIGDDGKPHAYKVTHMTDGTTVEEEDVNKTNTPRPELTGTLGELAKAQSIVADTTGKFTPEEKVAAIKFIKNFDAGTATRITNNINATAAGAPAKPDEVSFWADYFIRTGQYPPYGVLKASPNLSRAITAKVAEQANGHTGDVASQQQAFKALSASLTQQQKSYNSIAAFERTAGRNLDRAIDSARSIFDSGSPLLNEGVREFQKHVLGNPQLAAFETARLTAFTEVSRVLTQSQNGGGLLTDAARGEAEKTLQSNYTLKQLRATADMLHRDMKTRIEEQGAELNAIKEGLAGRGTGTAGGDGGIGGGNTGGGSGSVSGDTGSGVDNLLKKHGLKK